MRAELILTRVSRGVPAAVLRMPSAKRMPSALFVFLSLPFFFRSSASLSSELLMQEGQCGEQEVDFSWLAR